MTNIKQAGGSPPAPATGLPRCSHTSRRRWAGGRGRSDWGGLAEGWALASGAKQSGSSVPPDLGQPCLVQGCERSGGGALSTWRMETPLGVEGTWRDLEWVLLLLQGVSCSPLNPQHPQKGPGHGRCSIHSWGANDMTSTPLKKIPQWASIRLSNQTKGFVTMRQVYLDSHSSLHVCSV